VVLHGGRVLASGLVEELRAAAGVATLGDAFARLTEKKVRQ